MTKSFIIVKGDDMKKILWIGVLYLCLIPTSVYAEKELVQLSKCVDGDTAKFVINKKVYTTRFLAIDTPETKHPKKKEEPFGKEASAYTCKRLTNAKKIELEYDDASKKEDKYQRRLAWILVDGKLLQEELIEKGYAKVAYLYGDYKYTDVLKLEEKMARVNKRGLWNDDEVRKRKNREEKEMILKKLYKFLKKML